ncbi:hypothetical protein PROFUN_12719 [Planoprotostelium fungivorum]|uniref:Kinesin motor domain-containing protein n=1 Tax=Planoprotostelium fungivorum TaxID=1890364 RepID=A0A2P6N6F2_9EUKA|nr:hypothetical protein PROFUN_12719 [Planoprotostelium fungivorum]
MSSAAGNVLKTVNGPASRLKAPTKTISKPEDDKENVGNGIKRKADDSQRVKLQTYQEKKVLNSTISASTTRVKVDLNATAGPANKVRKTVPATSLSSTTRITTKPALPASARVKSEAAAKKLQADLDAQKTDQMKDLISRVEHLERDKAVKTEELVVKNSVCEKLESEKQCNVAELQNALKNNMELNEQMAIQLRAYNELVEKAKMTDMQLKSSNTQLESSRLTCERLKCEIDTQSCELAASNAEGQRTKTKLKSTEEVLQQRETKITELLQEIDDHKNTIKELEAQIREDENTRKKLHNTIQELKGNIRVFCRIRPYLGKEASEDNNSMEHYDLNQPGGKSLDIITSNVAGVSGKSEAGKKFQFTFDKVFKPDSTQAAVFDELSQLVQSALDGYNTCIFAYGQTGSGKTYTMEGPGIPNSDMDLPIEEQSTKDGKGMIPRAVEQIWMSAEQLKDKGWTYQMEATYVEIYNESIRDLLAKKQVTDDIKYDIKHDTKGNTTITNITTVKVRTPQQVYELLARASHNRSVGFTNMNERSSRSHSVFQLRLTGLNSFTTETVSGLLNLIDLAGSERLNSSGVTGQRLKETQHINKSLTHLGDVIAALANKDAHVPYRNSKLTYLLQNSLGGNSKTLMFVNISPRSNDLNETISSLRFATKVNACEIGTAKKQTKM